MYSLCQFRFDCDNVYAAFLPVAGDQTLDPLSPGQVVPMAVTFEIFFHKTFNGYFYCDWEPAVPASRIDAVEAGPAAERQGASLFVTAPPGKGADPAATHFYRELCLRVREVHPDILAVDRVIDAAAHDILRWFADARRVSIAGAMTFGMLERLSSRAGASASSP